jgi:hypothetical protein
MKAAIATAPREIQVKKRAGSFKQQKMEKQRGKPRPLLSFSTIA